MKRLLLLTVLTIVVCSKPGAAQSSNSLSSAKIPDKANDDIKEMLHNYSQKIYFTENKGQWPDNVLYKADFHLGQAIATKDGMLVGTFAPADVDAKQNWSMREEEAIRSGAKFDEKEPGMKGHGWLMNFVNHSPEMTIETQDKHTDVFNYFLANISQTSVNNYQEVWYKNVYSNVDVRYYPSKTGTLEYDIVCKPGFNKNEIAIQLTGIDKITVAKDGHLVFKTSVGDMDFPAPVAYQKGIGKKQIPIKVQYYITGNNVLHFTLGSYDESKTLIIDPIALRWATWMTNNSAAADHGHCIWIDPSDGGIYVVSRFAGAGLITANAFQNSFAGGSSYDLCIGKYYEPATVGGAGTRVWQTYLGGTGEDNPYSIIQGLDSAIYVTGYTGSTNFPLIGGTAFGTSANSINNGSQTANNIFITKISRDGQSIKSAIVGGNADDYAYDIGMDSYGDLTICGYTESTNLQTLYPATSASNTNNGGMDVLIFQITSNLENVNWMRNYGGNGDDVATILQQNPVTNEIYVAGYTESPSGKKNTISFPVSSNARQKTIGGSEDGFIQKLSSTGSTIWSSYFNSASGDNTQILCMQFNTTDNALYFGGLTNGLGTNNTPSGTYQTSIGGGTDFFCAAMDTNQTFVASTYIGGSGNEVNLMGLNVDLNNDVYLFGYTPSTNFPVTSDALQSTNKGNDDKVFFKLNTGLTSLIYSTYYGGASDDYDPVGERGIKFSNCRIYTIVTAESPDLPLTQGAITTHKLSSTSIYEPGIVEWSNPPDMSGNSLSGNQTLCAGGLPSSITGSVPTYSLPNIVRYSSTGSGADSTSVAYPVSYTASSSYQWQESTDSVNWTNITGATLQNLSGSLIGAVYKTTYLRRVIGGDACVVSPANSQIITIHVLTVTADVNNGCYNQNNGSITITTSTGTAPYTYSWSNGSTAQTRTGLAPATYNITLTDQAGCSATGSYTITNPAQLTASATSTMTTSCLSNATASVTVSGGTSPYTYSWSNGDIQPNIFNLSAGTYGVTVTDADGCTATSTTTVTGKAPPAITVNSPSICSGGLVALTASGAASYTWSPGTNLTTTTGASVTASPTTTTTYSVTGTSSNGCTATAISMVIVNSAPSVAASGTATICAGSPTTLYASCTGAGSECSGITYSWSPSSNVSPSIGASVAASPTATTTYTVTGTNSSGCTASGTVVVTATALPVVGVSVTSGNASYCTSGSATLTATGASSYTWAPNVALSSTTGATATATPTVTTTYTVTGTTGSCSNTATIVITVNIPVQVAVSSPATCANVAVNITASNCSSYTWTPSTDLNQTTGAVVSAVNPTVTTSYTVTGTDGNGCTTSAQSTVTVNTPVQITVNSLSICKGASTSLTANNASIYTWSPGTNLTSTTGGSVTANPTVTTSYTVTGTDGNGCTTSAQSIVTVNTPVQITVNSPSICNGASTTLTANNATTYTWSPAVELNKTTGASVSANPTITTSYTITGTDGNGCTTSAQSTVTVNTPVQITVNSPSICNGASTTLTANNATTYTWSPSIALNHTTGASVSANPTVTTSYTVTGTDGNGCTTSAQSTVTVNTPVQIIVNSPSICNGASTTLTANNATTYTWSPATALNHTTGASVSANPTVTTSYTITGIDGNGCTTSAQSTVTVNTPIQITVNSPSICNGASTTLTANNATTYTWSPATALNHTTGAGVSANPTVTTSYTVTGTDGNGCTTSAQSTVTVNTPVQITVNSPSICNGASTTLTANNATTYTWSPATALNHTTGAGVSANPTVTTSYTVTGTDGNGCTTSAQSTVTVNTPVQITVNSPSICNGASTTLTANNATTYTWSPATALNHTTGAGVSANPTITTSYTVTGTDGNGCTTSAQSTVTVNTPVQITVNSPSICNGASTTLNANNATTYTWSPATALNHTTGAGVSANPTITTSYTVTGTDGNGCTTSAQSTVTVNTPVQITVNSPSICNGASTTLNANNATTYTWSPATALNHTTGVGVSANPTITTSYTVTGTDGNGCTTSAQSIVTVNTPVQITVNNPSICNGASTTLTANNATTYTWSPTTALNHTTGASVSANPTITTLYTITGTDGNGCTTSAQSTVTVNTPVQITVNSPSICNGASTTLTANNATTYTWSPATTLNHTTGASVSANPTVTTSYTITGTDGNGCTTSVQSTVTVNTPVQITVNSPSICNGASTTLTANNATTYRWSPATALNHTTGASVSANPTVTTSYTVTGTDGNGCTTSAQSTVTVNTPVQITVNSPSICNGASTTLTANNATTYAWSPATALNHTTGAGVSANPTVTTSYTITGTDGNGCTTSAQSTVTVNTPVQITVNNPSICNGASTTLTANNATTYTWSPATALNHTTGASVSANPTVTTSYTITGTDGNGCTTSAQSTVTVNTPVQITVNSPSICNGASTTLTANNATTYTWSPATALNYTTGASVSANPIVTTSYTITGTDGNGCTTSAQSTVTVNTPVQITVNSPSICNGASTTLTANNATTYTWSPATALNYTTGASVSANPIVTTSYTITGTDGNGCTTSAQSTITVNTPVQITVNNPSICNGASTTLTANNATTYTWSLVTGLNRITGASVSANPTVTTSYTITGTDGNGCTTSAQSIVIVNTPLQITVNSPSICNGASTTLTANNATTYTWSPSTGLNHTTGASVSANPTVTTSYTITGTDGNGCTTSAQSIVIVNTPLQITVNSPSICNGASTTLTANNATTYTWSPATALNHTTGASVSANPTVTTSYTITGTDGNGCTTSAQSTVTVNTPVQITVNSPSICNGASTTLTANNATSYIWSPATALNHTTGASVSANPTVTTSYTVTGTDGNGCTTSAQNTVTVNTPVQITVNNPSICNGASTTLTANNATTYTWSPSTALNHTTGASVSANPTVTTPYTITGTDGNGCTTSAISTLTINALPIVIINGTAIICSYDSSLLTANANPESESITSYQWQVDANNITGQTNNTYTATASGNYSVIVTNSNGCTATSPGFILTKNTALSINGSITNASCNGVQNGSVNITVSGGTPSYTYTWSNGASTENIGSVSTGNYVVTVTDSYGCSASQSFYVGQPSSLSFTGSVTNANCNGDSNGAINLSVNGGSPNYTYTWSNEGTTQNISGLNAATYSVSVSDSHNCSVSQSFNVTQPTALSLIARSVDASCYGSSDGVIAMIVSGGSPTYTYHWSNGATAQFDRNLIPGTYTVTVSDSHHCSAISTTTVNQPDSIVMTPVIENVSCYGMSNGSITLTVVGGVPTDITSINTGDNYDFYKYKWGNGDSIPNPDSLTAGSYTVTVTDANNCSAISTFQVQQPLLLVINGSAIPVNCNGSSSGSVNITVSGGTPQYSYSWNNQATTQNINGVVAGNYIVTVTDSLGCSTNKSFEVDEPVMLTINGISTDANCNGDQNGAVNITVGGGSPNYTYSWSNNATTQNITGVGAGTYSVTVTDSHNCSISQSFSVGQPTILTLSGTPTNANCNGDQNGAVNITVGGGSPSYTYSWSNNATTQNISGVGAGTYAVTVTDSHNCSISQSFSVGQPTILTLGGTATDANCNGNNNGAVNITVGGGSPNYTYSWNNNSTTQNISGVGEGTYSVTVTDSHNCSISQSFTVGQPTILTLSGTATDANCNGDHNGAVNITVGGGSPSYTYSWSNNSTTQNISGVGAGTYAVTVTDSHNCSISQSFTVGQPTILTLGGTATDANCNGDHNGAVNITVGGGSPNYTYSWSNNATTQNISGVGAGTYSVTVTDSHNCSISQSFSVGQPTILTLGGTATDANCNGDQNGAVNITVGGGSPNYTYSWSNNATTQNISGVGAGTYVVTVTDSHNCSISQSFSVGQPTILTLSGTPTDANCNGDQNGAVNITVGGGSPNYTYSWNNNSTTQNISGVGEGTYSVTVTDSHNCSISQSFTVGQPTILTLNGTATDANCNGNNNGAVNITVGGGSPSYTYSWSNNSTTQNISGVGAGTYAVTVTDSHNCSISQSFSVGQPTILTLGGTATDANCNGNNNGAVNITVGGGSPNYTYSWNNNSTTQNISGVGAGTYAVTVTDSHNCSISQSFSVGQPTILTLGGTATDANCNGNNNGAVNITVGGGSPNYTYSWNNNSTTQNISGVGEGTYSVTVTDSHNCSISQSFTVGQPTILTLSGTATDANCNGDHNGAVNITVGGGSPSYTYSWSNNSTTQNISGVGAGTYAVTVTDSHNCSISQSFTVGQPTVLTLGGAATNANCNGDQNGAVNITVGGGSPNYTYSWSNNATTQNISGVGAGTYAVTVTDSHNCSISQSFTVGQPTILTLNGTTTDANCNGNHNGAVNITVGGGSPSYTYSWSNNSTTQNISGVGAGTYAVTVTDSHNCSISQSFSVGQPTILTLGGTATDANCNGDQNGAVNITVGGGSPNYTYSWSNNATTQNINGVGAGTYVVTVTDSHNCSISQSFNVGQPTILTLGGTATDANCNGNQNGAVNITVGGGSPNYTYSWSNNATTQNISGVGARTYAVTVTDSHNCSVSQSFNVGQPTILTLGGTATDANCNGNQNGAVNITVGGGSPSYTYSWSNNATTQNISGVGAGTYAVTVTDSHNCSISQSFNINQPDSLHVTISKSDVTCHSSCNGSTTVSVAGGSGNYTISWNKSISGFSPANLCAGTYCYTVSDAHNCTKSSCITIAQPDTLMVSLQSNSSCILLDSCHASVSVITTGGAGNYGYSWAGPSNYTGVNNDTIKNLCSAGVYAVTVTDGNSCTATGNTGLVCNSCPSGRITISGPKSTCVTSLPVTLTANTTAPALTYTWSNGATTQSINVSTGGIYTVAVVFGDCQASVSDTLVIKPQPSATSQQTNVECHGACNGTITLSVSNVNAYATTWNGPNGYTSSNLNGVNNLCAGIYCYTVNADGCTVSNCDTITETQSSLSAVATPTNVSCYGGANGSISMNITGGTNPYSVQWANQQLSGAQVSGLSVGTYCYTVYDANRCSVTGCSTVNQPDSINVTVNKINVSCYNACNGKVKLTAIGGTAPYSYQWNIGDGVIQDSLSSLCAGVYCYTVSDNNGCSKTGCVRIKQPDSLVVATTIQNISCYGGSCNGSAALNASGGTAPYQYQWNIGDGVIQSNLSGLCVGTYCYTATDNNGCNKSGCITIGQPDSLNVTTTIHNISCNGLCNGSAALNVNGGTTPYKYQWDIGDGVIQSNISGLCTGMYCYTVTDNNGCTKSGCITITQPDSLAVTTTVHNITCNGVCNGSAAINVSGGTAPYQYQWNIGDGVIQSNLSALCAGTYCYSVTDANGCVKAGCVTITQPDSLKVTSVVNEASANSDCNGSSTITVSGGVPSYSIIWNSNIVSGFTPSGLCSGTYCYTVTDANKCSKTGCITITQPTAIALTVATTAASCSNTASGAATATCTGGTPPYSYRWSNSSTTCTVSGLYATEQYCVTVTCAGGGTASKCVTISQSTPVSISVTSTNVTCNGLCNGVANVTVSGGTTPYTYKWSNNATTSGISGLCTGQYCVTVTSKSGCSASKCVTIYQLAPTAVSITSNAVSCNGSCNGTADVVLTGGIGPFSYHWSNEASTASIVGLCSGLYSVTVSTVGSCPETQSVTISQPTPISIQVATTNASCSNTNDGTANVTATGGKTPYTYRWSNSVTTASVTGLSGGSYSVSVMSPGGCSVSKGFTITRPAPLTISITTTPITCEHPCSGTATVNVTSGTSPYSYHWANDQTTSSISGLCSGTYTVKVTTATGCSLSQSGNISPVNCGDARSESNDSPSSADSSVAEQFGTDNILEVFPNPFDTKTNIELISSTDLSGSLDIFDIGGQKVSEIYSGKIQAGQKYTFSFNAELLPSGMYICRLTTNEGIKSVSLIKVIR